MDEDNKLSYFFLGIGLGVVAGVLFAPKSGAETREFLVSKANEGADLAKRRAEEVADLAKRRAEEVRDAAVETYDRGVSTVQKHKENLAAAVEAGRQAYRESTSKPTVD